MRVISSEHLRATAGGPVRQSALEKVWSRERVGYIQYIFLSFKRGLDLDSGIKRGSPHPGLDSDGRVGRMWLLRASSGGIYLLPLMSFLVEQHS